jgi:hypothetical protein
MVGESLVTGNSSPREMQAATQSELHLYENDITADLGAAGST